MRWRRQTGRPVSIGDHEYRFLPGSHLAEPSAGLLRESVPDMEIEEGALSASLGMSILDGQTVVAASILYGMPGVNDPSRGLLCLSDVAVRPGFQGAGLAKAVWVLTVAALDAGDLLIGQCPSHLVAALARLGATVLPEGQPLESALLGGAVLNYRPSRPHWFLMEI